jgi:NADH:ubiquinone oxidoreductase subunit C
MIALTAMGCINMMENKMESQSTRRRAVPVYSGHTTHEVILGMFLGVVTALKLLTILQYHLLKVTLVTQVPLKSTFSTVYQLVKLKKLEKRSIMH